MRFMSDEQFRILLNVWGSLECPEEQGAFVELILSEAKKRGFETLVEAFHCFQQHSLNELLGRAEIEVRSCIVDNCPYRVAPIA